MKKTEYEMPPEYHESTAKLLELYEMRDEYEKKLRDFPLLMTDEMRRGKFEVDREIDKFENALAEQYEAHQLYKSLEDTQNQLADVMLLRTMEMYINIKHKAPELLEGFEKLIHESFSPEDVEAYLDQVAIMETTRLKEILADKTTNSDAL
jgi:hypothetical protein